ncbi:hypothetical protein CKQ79_28885, partial [Klebsiella pneumoniae]
GNNVFQRPMFRRKVSRFRKTRIEDNYPDSIIFMTRYGLKFNTGYPLQNTPVIKFHTNDIHDEIERE